MTGLNLGINPSLGVLRREDGLIFRPSRCILYSHDCKNRLASVTLNSASSSTITAVVMSKDSKRFWILVSLCGLLGIGMGATTSQAAINECLADETPSNECMTQDPATKKLEGIGMGLMVGVCAAFGAAWRFGDK